ncbi:chymotrypsin-like [Cylas formicarius]|uniref:chymotrypsin-like n=1 Tax=Cylas formicarius TaxID=197179 RepID=UPI0029588846|nr:chymotrypsin-like [Cylas formicarius]
MQVILIAFLISVGIILCLPQEGSPPGLRIVNGTNASVNSRPYHALISGKSDLYNGAWACQGVLISNNYILTSAMCAWDADRINITLGLNSVANQTGVIYYQTTGDSVTFHPRYSKGEVYDNLALIQLPQPVTPSDTVRSVQLPDRSQANNLFENVTGVVSGWGNTDSDLYNSTPAVLKESQQRVMNWLECEDTLWYFIDENLICTMGIDGVPCISDHGAPLIINNQLIGVLSEASNNCTIPVPSVFTKIPMYLDWLAQNTDVNVTAL